MTRRARWLTRMAPRLMTVLVACGLALCGVEVVLRIQQAMGPIYDVSFARREIRLSTLSDTLNHSAPLYDVRELTPKRIYGDLAGTTFEIRRTELGIRQNPLRAEPPSGSRKILFFGDSFVEGYDHAHTLPHMIWELLAKEGLELEVLNAAHGSYSPALFLPQARMLLPALRPDLIVIDIDETDFADDLHRYEHLATFNDEGRVLTVAPSPGRVAWLHGLAAAEDSFTYVGNLLHRFYLTRRVVPKLFEESRANYWQESSPFLVETLHGS